MSNDGQERKLGYLYESLFNVGLLKVLKENLNFYPYWLKELENYPLIGYALNIFSASRVTELFKQSLSRVLFTYFTQGYTFGKKLLEDLETLKNGNPTVFFYYGKPIPIEDDKDFFLQRFGEKFGNLSEEFVKDEKGSLLHVDLVLHFTTKGKLHYITVADLSLYGASDLFGGYDSLNSPDLYQSGLTRIYNTDLKGVAQGYLFKPINLKGGGNFKELLNKLLDLKTKNPERLKEFFKLLEWKNREVAKLVQASSYAGEYLKLLLQKGIIDEKTPIVLRIFGITLHKVAQISFSPKVGLREVLNLLGKAKEIYSSTIGNGWNRDRFMEEYTEKLQKFFMGLNSPVEGIKVEFQPIKTNGGEHIVFKEVWKIDKEYRLNLEKRKKHKGVFREVLKNSRWIANLGVPGIGKTTTIFELFGKNSLILYTSPRTFLNTELIEKWCDKNENMVAFYTQSEHPDTVFYLSKDKNFSLPDEINIPKLGKVRLKRLKDHLEENEELSTVREVTYTTSSDRRLGEKGVLNRLLKMVAYLLEDKNKPLKGKEILVAFATQAVVKRKDGGSTFDHIRNFFLDKYRNPAFGGEVLKVLKKRFISNGIRDIVFVMDEITGSETGRFLFRQFVKEEWFKKLQEVAQKRLNLRLYFALLDASLKGVEVFKTFAEDTDERPVVYIDTQPKVENLGGIQISEVSVKGGVTFTAIDAVGFPAGELEIIYDFHPFEDRNKKLVPTLATLIKNLLQKGNEQIFLFWQDKKQLEKLKEFVTEKEKLLEEDEILVIHSLSERKGNVDHKKIRLILTTSSASRGLTFPLIDTYIAVIPDFSVENNLTELVQALFRGRDRIGEKHLEDGKRRIFFIFPLERDNEKVPLHKKARSFELATLLRASLFTITCGGTLIPTPEGERVLKVVPVGVQREKTFHPLKELERRISSTKRVLKQIQRTAKGKIGEKATILDRELDNALQRARINLPFGGLEAILKLLENVEKAKTVKDFLKLNVPEERNFEFLTVKGHNLIFATSVVRTEFELNLSVEKKRLILKLLEEIEKGEPKLSLGLKPLKDYLKRGKMRHTDLKPVEVYRVLLFPILCWNYEDMDPNEVTNLDIPSYLRMLLKLFLGEIGNFHPQKGYNYERPFGITDLDKHLFDEINGDFLRSGNLIFSSEVNMLEFFL
ncbi:MAG: hypothetical protein DSZ31_03455 [Gammaproteobacteria bacterium]|nr:MAG: hypothetical protein DSZ31_03455 [Gammaproteobacteria bacterium]